jgi:hypothetical protein
MNLPLSATPAMRKHFFRDEQDNRTVVVTVMMREGRYKSYVLEGENEDLDVRGYGDTRMEAIADLNDKIKAEG